eukprot:scaffold2114_cov253-Pinguiococcus_pyrenoidosus.AAC.7
MSFHFLELATVLRRACGPSTFDVLGPLQVDGTHDRRLEATCDPRANGQAFYHVLEAKAKEREENEEDYLPFRVVKEAHFALQPILEASATFQEGDLVHEQQARKDDQIEADEELRNHVLVIQLAHVPDGC